MIMTRRREVVLGFLFHFGSMIFYARVFMCARSQNQREDVLGGPLLA